MDTTSPSFVKVIHDISIVSPWVLRLALTTGLLRRISERSSTAPDVASDLGANPQVCAEVIDYLAAIDYVDIAKGGEIALTELGTALAQLPPDLYEAGSPTVLFDRAASELGSAWSHGGPVASRRSTPYWDEVASSPKASATIGRYQPRTVQFDGQQLVEAIRAELGSAGSSVLDLGGSNGALARDISTLPADRVGVLDLPAMIPNAEQNLADLPSARLSFHGDSFFEPVPPGYDIYVLNAILYDYTDQQVARLFSGLRASMPEGSVLIVSELLSMFADPYTQAESSLLLTLNTGGRPRSSEQVAQMARTAGYASPRHAYSSEQRYTLVLDH